MAQEFNFGCPEDTLVLPGDEAILAEPLEDDLEVLEVLFPRVGEHEDVVHVTHAEGQVTEDVGALCWEDDPADSPVGS